MAAAQDLVMVGHNLKSDISRVFLAGISVMWFWAADGCQEQMQQSRQLLYSLAQDDLVEGVVQAEVEARRLTCVDESTGPRVEAVAWSSDLVPDGEGFSRSRSKERLTPFEVRSADGQVVRIEGPPPEIVYDQYLYTPEEWYVDPEEGGWFPSRRRECEAKWIDQRDPVVTALGTLTDGHLKPEMLYRGAAANWVRDTRWNVVKTLSWGLVFTLFFCVQLLYLAPTSDKYKDQENVSPANAVTRYTLWELHGLLGTRVMKDLFHASRLGRKGWLVYACLFWGVWLFFSGVLFTSFTGNFLGLMPHPQEDVVVGVSGAVALLAAMCLSIVWKKKSPSREWTLWAIPIFFLFLTIMGCVILPFSALVKELLISFSALILLFGVGFASSVRSFALTKRSGDYYLAPDQRVVTQILPAFFSVASEKDPVELRRRNQSVEMDIPTVLGRCRLQLETGLTSTMEVSLGEARTTISWPGDSARKARLELLYWLEAQGAEVFVRGDEFDPTRASTLERGELRAHPEFEASQSFALTSPSPCGPKPETLQKSRSQYRRYCLLFGTLVSVPIGLSVALLVCLLIGVAVGTDLHLERWFYAPLVFLPGAFWAFDRRSWLVANTVGPPEHPMLEVTYRKIRLEETVIDLTEPFRIELTVRPAARREVVLMGIHVRSTDSGESLTLATPILRASVPDGLYELDTSSAPLVEAEDFANTLWPLLRTCAQMHGQDLVWNARWGHDDLGSVGRGRDID